MASTPTFTNAVAKAIKRVNSDVQCVIYTRHPTANELDPELLVINFTVEGDADPRLAMAPKGARLVGSAWDGALSEIAEINFLEHHVEKSSSALGVGFICPVTVEHARGGSCDGCRCQACFVDVAESLKGPT